MSPNFDGITIGGAFGRSRRGQRLIQYADGVELLKGECDVSDQDEGNNGDCVIDGT